MHLSTVRKLAVDIAPKVPVFVIHILAVHVKFHCSERWGQTDWFKNKYINYKYSLNYVDEFHRTCKEHVQLIFDQKMKINNILLKEKAYF